MNEFIKEAPKSINIEELEHEIFSAVKEFSAQEIKNVQTTSTKLIPQDVALTIEETETLRYLCALSEVSLQPPLKIQSHRRFIGPAIVMVKRSLVPILQFFLKDTYKAQTLFNRGVIKVVAQTIQASKKN